ncbi:MAG: serine/threonine protein kinase [Candidatus Thiodiazotropha sp. (ex Lucinoma aequizonata)]|nr:serine/threonine protein kinase [Candidatus Thiodiazotropha sp. (ex Lucinoma aequizonata)]MCU7887427.1 serine/threonine protein kinase [Candidatus Thiodiazotropha sp. (ex Lucinoma aequizonata)]MCU7895026.1 serine/threonine protein kinase [Candidatus Thiodiazotropha sp. (ex Lucinoma aequizonata)]MCU7897963.1 serine/threonine protein kinase [Candidatus Thiodiazotropha sp. (ex Lucinoma aequizonata)]MCU7900703.1 serine/threonine protein kinase [Candidatus Thiodiazotropha sp. (ex Lucinoma aequizo
MSFSEEGSSGKDKHAFATLTPDTMLDAIESIGGVCSGQFLALNSYENRVYQVGMEEGPPLVSKFYRPKRWGDQAILEEHQFTLDLAEQEIPVIAPLINAEANTLLHYESCRFTLYPCKGGRAPELDNPDQLEQLGRFIGRIHLLGATRSFQYRPGIDIESYLQEPSRYLLEHEFIPHHLLAAYESLLKDLVTRIEDCYARAGSVSYIRLHGDCHPGNILWRDNGPQIVDFDDARTGPAMQDLWMFLSGDRGYMNERLADLLEGYIQFYDFNPSELHLLEALRTLRLVHYAGWLARRWDDPAFPQAFPWFDTTRFWEEHILILREQLARMDEPALIW